MQYADEINQDRHDVDYNLHASILFRIIDSEVSRQLSLKALDPSNGNRP